MGVPAQGPPAVAPGKAVVTMGGWVFVGSIAAAGSTAADARSITRQTMANQLDAFIGSRRARGRRIPCNWTCSCHIAVDHCRPPRHACRAHARRVAVLD